MRPYFRLSYIVLLLFLFISPQLRAQNAVDLYRQSSDAYEGKNYEKALSLINKSIEKDPTRAEYFTLRAKIFLKQNEYDNTIKDCYRVLELKPNNPDAYMLRGEVCMVTKSYGGAILFFGKTINYTNDNNLLFKAFVNRGDAYFNLGKFSDANNDYLSAYEIDPLSTDVLYPLAETYLKMNQSKEALYTIDKIIKGNPDYAPAYRLLGTVDIGNKEYEKALEDYNKYIKLEPEDGEIYLDIARLYIQMEKLDLAIQNANKALSILPNEPEVFKVKSEAYFQQGLKDEGCNNLFRAFQMGYIEKYGFGVLDEYIKKCEDTQ